jgi:maleylpyruvate isomerase
MSMPINPPLYPGSPLPAVLREDDGKRVTAGSKGNSGYGQRVTADPLVLAAELDRATDRLLATAGALDGTSATPSRLPGWSRGHVLTHVARNADAMRNLLAWARTGEPTPAYASQAARAALIKAGAGRPLGEQIADVRDSANRFAEYAAAMPAEAWQYELPLPTGTQRAALVIWRRLREVEVHHVDLAAGYEPAAWPESFAHRLLHEVAAGLHGIDLTVHAADLGHPLMIGSGGPPTISGRAATLAGWLTGRVAEPELMVAPGGPLPAPPNWL